MSDRKEFRDLASPAEARETIASLDLAPDPERVPLAEARGRVLAERVDAPIDVPGFDRASMDGYAVRARDTFGADEADPAVLDVVGEVHAGDAPAVAVGEGDAVEISTGAVLPGGADAVVMVERTTERDGAVEIRTSVAPGDSVMLAGADVAAGERALGPGTRLTPREVGLLSALGLDEVVVRGRPTVGIVSTGDELVRPGDELDHRRGQIHDVNSYAVAAAVEEAGGEPRLYPHVGDVVAEMERVLLDAARSCDLVLTSGSTSASAVDVVYRVVEERGELLLHGVAVKPGKPMLVGTVGDAAYVGLPGYPVSALTIFRTFVAPAVREAAGLPAPETATVAGEMAVRERYAEGRRRLLPVGLVEDGAGNTLVYPVDKGSGATTSLVEADGVVAVPADTEYLAAGERVTVELFSPDVRPPSLLGVGEDDPALSRLLDRLSGPRYLAVGTREGLRRLRNGVPDVCVAAGPPGRDRSVEGRDGHVAGDEDRDGHVAGDAGDDGDVAGDEDRDGHVAGDEGDDGDAAGDEDRDDHVAGDAGDDGDAAGDEDRDGDAAALGGWTRRWGLVVPAGNPEDVEGPADLVDRDLRFVNRGTDSGLRTSLEHAVDELAAERGVARGDLTAAVHGWDLAARGHESPARTVAAGEADAGLGLAATAAALDLGFVPLGAQAVRVLASPDRVDKPGVAELADALDRDLIDVLAGLDGYESDDPAPR